MISRNNISQSRLNQTRKKDKSRCKQLLSVSLTPTLQQLSLFDSPKVTEQHYLNNGIKDDQPYTLQIGYIPDKLRSAPDKFCNLVHYESGLKLPGQFTYKEAKEILRITRDWDWKLNGLGIPRCRDKLLLLLNNFSNKGGEADA